MTESAYEQLVAQWLDRLREKQKILETRYGIGTYARFDHDGDADLLTFSNPGSEMLLEARTTDIGSYSLKTQTWLWAWANQSRTDAGRAKSARLKELFEVTGMRTYLDPHLDADEYLAWELAAASVDHLGAVGCYRAPFGHLLAFMSIDEVREVRKAR